MRDLFLLCYTLTGTYAALVRNAPRLWRMEIQPLHLVTAFYRLLLVP